jgi:hypothetical protein
MARDSKNAARTLINLFYQVFNFYLTNNIELRFKK